MGRQLAVDVPRRLPRGAAELLPPHLASRRTHETFTTLDRLDDVLRSSSIQVGQGPPGNERAFRAAYKAAGGQQVLGEPASEVYDDDPGWVQHFHGGPGQPEAVICARAGHDPVAMDATIWDALRTISPGQLTDVGYPVQSVSPAFIDGASHTITLDGGQWGPGELVRRELAAHPDAVSQARLGIDQGVVHRDSPLAMAWLRRSWRGGPFTEPDHRVSCRAAGWSEVGDQGFEPGFLVQAIGVGQPFGGTGQGEHFGEEAAACGVTVSGDP